MPSFDTILITDAGSIRTITLSRPERRNALTQTMIRELTKTFIASACDEKIRVLILTGAGDAFCSGLDLSELRKMSSQDEASQRTDSDRIAAMMRALYDCPVPTVAAVHGAAVAGGMGLATICDFTLADIGAKFGYPEVKIGFLPAIVSAFLVRQVGDKQARDLLLTGRLMDAAEAYEMGLVTKVISTGTVIDAANELAQSLLNNSPASMRATKRLLHGHSIARLTHELAAASEANAEMRKTTDFTEGLSAFLDKRKPVWDAVKKTPA